MHALYVDLWTFFSRVRGKVSMIQRARRVGGGPLYFSLFTKVIEMVLWCFFVYLPIKTNDNTKLHLLYILFTPIEVYPTMITSASENPRYKVQCFFISWYISWSFQTCVTFFHLQNTKEDDILILGSFNRTTTLLLLLGLMTPSLADSQE